MEEKTITYNDGTVIERINENAVKITIPLKLIVKKGMPDNLQRLKDDFNFYGKYHYVYKTIFTENEFIEYSCINVIPFNKRG